ncbi:hypothetical protein [Streptomyces sp. NPDC059262]|uniref:hypothetical protein n=1 Tax=Streptomyces sp. NPDC059262 TaxID=3346797 RepID=UPI0036B07053
MEILVKGGTVKQSEGIETENANLARAIVNHLAFPEMLRGATIVHNIDENYTGIRFATNAGPVLLMLPVAPGFDFQLIHESEKGPVILQTIKARERNGVLHPRVIGFRLSDVLRNRGLK